MLLKLILCVISFAFKSVILWADDPEPDFNYDDPKALTEAIKKILPSLVKAGEVIEDFKSNIEVVKDVTKRLETLEGTITEMDKKVIQIGNKRVEIKPSGLSGEEKIDFSKYMIAIYKQSKPETAGEKHANVMKEIYEKYPSKAMTEGTDADGGYLVPDMFIDTIWRAAEQASVALTDCTKVPLTTGYKLPILSLASGVSVAWKAEAAAAGQSNPTVGKSTEAAQKLFAYSQLSNELLEDEETGLTDLIITLFGEAIGAEIDNQVFNGDGTVFTGVLEASGVNTVTMASGEGAFADVTADHLSDMISLIKASVIAGAKFYMHRTIFNHIRKLKSTTGEYIYQPPAGTQPPTIWSYPYQIAEQMPANSASAVSTPFMFFGSLKYYLLGTKGDMTIRISDIPRLLNDETVIVVRRRIACALALAEAMAVLKTNAVDS